LKNNINGTRLTRVLNTEVEDDKDGDGGESVQVCCIELSSSLKVNAKKLFKEF